MLPDLSGRRNRGPQKAGDQVSGHADETEHV
jgi:hypothetical protein